MDMAKRAAVPLADLASSIRGAGIGLGLISSQDRWLDANEHLCRLVGYTREELLRLGRADTTHPDDVAEETAQLERVRRGKAASVQIEQRYRGKTGGFIWVNVTAARNDSRKKGAGDLLLVVQDASARRETLKGLGVQHLVSRLIVEAKPGDETIPRVLAEVATALGWSYAAFWEKNPGTSGIRAVHTWSRSGSEMGAFDRVTRKTVFALGEGIAGRAWELGRPFWESDMTTPGTYPRSEAASKVGLHSAFAFPIRTSDRFFGVMEFFGEDVLPPDRTMLDAAEGVGYQLGEFLERGRATAAERESQALRSSIVDTALDCIITIDHTSVITEFNPAAEATFRYRRPDVIGRPMVDLIIPPSYREAHLRGMKRYLATGEAHVLGRRFEITAMRSDGSEFPVELAIVRVPLEGPPFFTAYLRDLTERKKLESEQNFLLKASEQLAASLDYEATIASIANLAVPDIADWCAVDVVDKDGTIRRVAVAHQDPAKIALVQELQDKYPSDPNARFGTPEVLRTGEPELASEIPDSLLRQAARSEEHLAAIQNLGLRSYLIVPLRSRGATFGTLNLVYAESGRRFEKRDLQLASELARRIGSAIENARLLQDSEEARFELEQQAAEMEIQATEMEQTQEQMEITNQELQAVNQQLREKTREVRTALEQAEEANRAKSDFLAAVSHELRTPLNAISGYTELLSMGIRGPVTEAQKADLDRINRSQSHLLGIINDILKFAKLESGQLEMTVEEFPVDGALASLEELIRPQLDAKRITYRFERGDETVKVRSDRDRFQQIILNLLGNAVKFTADGGTITVRWELHGEQLLTHVSDTGIGIAPEQLERIFDPFVQVESGTTRTSQGVGLGLAIGQDMARQMRGDITVVSEEGKGSTFTLALQRGA